MASQPLPGSANHREREAFSLCHGLPSLGTVCHRVSTPPSKTWGPGVQPVNFTQNYISCSFENIPERPGFRCFSSCLTFLTVCMEFRSTGDLRGDLEVEFYGHVPLLGQKSCGGGSKLELVRAHEEWDSGDMRRLVLNHSKDSLSTLSLGPLQRPFHFLRPRDSSLPVLAAP